MPNTKSAKKSVRQTTVKRLDNRAKKSRIKTEIKKIEDLIEAKDAAQAQEQLKVVCQALDKAAKTNVIHKNTAARKKGQIAKKVQQLGA
ncbi:30S ribosomal protein S20 [Planctomycetota bacterium]